jgi:hypothetical protein
MKNVPLYVAPLKVDVLSDVVFAVLGIPLSGRYPGMKS